jgi:hypothetical protein
MDCYRLRRASDRGEDNEVSACRLGSLSRSVKTTCHMLERPTGNDGSGQMMRVKVGTIDRLALLCISVLGAALAVIGGAIALGFGGAILGLGLSMMVLAVFYAILG